MSKLGNIILDDLRGRVLWGPKGQLVTLLYEVERDILAAVLPEAGFTHSLGRRRR